MKKILVLGAMQMHIPLLKRAKERGLYVITCDYLPENEGHKYADKPYFDSTTDLEAVLKIAKDEKIDSVLTFNSDPAALTAAYISSKLSLPGNSFDVVRIMSEKDLFRSFLLENNFNVPQFKSFTSIEDLKSSIHEFKFPILLKPVDSSGSKGIVKIERVEEVEPAFENAIKFSRCKRIIIEEFIEAEGAQMHGDAFVQDGKVEFIYLGDHHFNSSINNLVPVSTTFPSCHSKYNLQRVEDEVQRFITAIGFKQGGINIEARISAYDGKVYLIEIGPRNGGNFTPLVIQYASGFNFVDAVLDCSLGLNYSFKNINKKGFFAYLILHSEKEGKLNSIIIDEVLKNKIFKEYIYLKKGDQVYSFKGANTAIGVLLASFKTIDEMSKIANNLSSYFKINLQ